jgi:hypothetical protein
MREDLIYILTKKFFVKKKFDLLAGQPPSGSDNLPVIEIKTNKKEKGSKDSYIPDLVVINYDYIVIVECKPRFNQGDIDKIDEIDKNELRIKNFYNEILSRNLLIKYNFLNYFNDYETFKNKLRYCLSFNGNFSELEKINIINFSDDKDSLFVEAKNSNYKIIISE